MASNYETVERIRVSHRHARPDVAENPAWANCHKDCGILLTEIDRLERELVERMEPPDIAEWERVHAERDAIRSDFDALGAHYREALAERDKWKARAEAAEKLAIGSIRFMEEDFPEAPEELDRACVSGPYLDHYKALLALMDSKT